MNQFESGAREIAEQVNDDGLILAQEGDLAGALKKFTEASQIDPSYAEAYSNIGNCHRFLGKADVALTFYNKAVELDPAASQPYYNRATIFEDTGERQKAIADYEAFLAAGGAERFGLEEEVRLAIERLKAAPDVEQLEPIESRSEPGPDGSNSRAPSPSPVNPRATTAISEREASRPQPGGLPEPRSAPNMSASGAKDGQPGSPDQPAAQFQSERGAAAESQAELSGSEPQKMESSKPGGSDEPPSRFKPIILDDHYGGADRKGKEEIDLPETTAEGTMSAGRIVFADKGEDSGDLPRESGGESDPLEDLNEEEIESEQSPTAAEIAQLYFDRGVDCYERGDIQGAIDNLSEAIAYDLHSEDVYNYRGVAFMRQGQLPEAAEDFTNALGLNPDSVEASANRGTVFRLFNELDRALGDYERAIAMQPGVAAFYYQRGIIHHKRKHNSLAITDFDRSLSIEPNNASVHYYRAVVLEADGRLDDAVRDYDKALKLDPNKTEAYLSRALAQIRLRRFGKAADDLNTYLKAGRGTDADIQLAQRALASIKPMLLT